jgi:glycosyltransferase involved in cell wall biosynthesis
VIAECTWQPGSRTLAGRAPWFAGALGRASGLALRALDGDHVHYCVLSTAELDRFPATWGVDPDRVWFTPFHTTVWDLDQPTRDDGYVFAGGDPLRDYATLLAAERRTGHPLRIASRREPPRSEPGLRIAAEDPGDYERLLLGATVVVVPLRDDPYRSAGQQSYLNAMAVGKPTIVTDVAGVRDHLVPGEHALVVPPGDAGALSDALAWCLHPDHRAEALEMAERGRRHVLARYTQRDYLAALLAVASEAERTRSP